MSRRLRRIAPAVGIPAIAVVLTATAALALMASYAVLDAQMWTALLAAGLLPTAAVHGLRGGA